MALMFIYNFSHSVYDLDVDVFSLFLCQSTAMWSSFMWLFMFMEKFSHFHQVLLSTNVQMKQKKNVFSSKCIGYTINTIPGSVRSMCMPIVCVEMRNESQNNRSLKTLSLGSGLKWTDEMLFFRKIEMNTNETTTAKLKNENRRK